MLAKIAGVALIAIGIAGLVLPVIPGMLLVMVGALLFFKDKEYAILKLLNEKGHPSLIAFYHNTLSRIVNGGDSINIDWEWVKDMVKKSEKIGADDSQRSLDISKNLDECLERAKSLSKPNYISMEKKITGIRDNVIEIDGGIKFSAGRISQYIKDAESAAIFLVTIGNAIENTAGELSRGEEPLQGYLLDRIGSFAVESLAESIENKLRKGYSRLDKSVSRRYSPGYCDWPIEEQQILSKVIDFSRIGVSLTESCMMSPKKSISAMVAIADKGVFTKSGSTCEICEKSDCSYRRDT